jgi:hypothetical protein
MEVIMPIQYYDAILEKLQYPQKEKIHKIIALGCLHRVHEDLWVCNPILGYNKTAYTLKRGYDGRFKCNCQGNNKRGYCSHSNALLVILSDREKEKQGVLF